MAIWGMALSPPGHREILQIHPHCRERFLPRPDGGVLALSGFRLAGISDLRTDYLIDRGARNFHTLFFTKDGAGRVCTGGETFTSTKGHLLVLPRHLPYRMTLHRGAWQVFWFHLTGAPPFSGLEGSPLRHRRAVHLEALGRTMEEYVEAYSWLDKKKLGSPPHHFSSDPLAESLGATILEYLKKELQVGDGPKDRQLEALRSLWRLVQKKPADHWRISLLSSQIGVTPRHFTRLCQRYWHQEPRAILAGLRISQARELLMEPDYTLSAVADRVGFANPYALSEAFQRITGMRPSVWRSRALFPLPGYGREGKKKT